MYSGMTIRKSKLTCETDFSPRQFLQHIIVAFVSSPSVWSLLDSNSNQGSLCDWELGCLEDSWWVLLLYPATPTWKITTGFPASSFSLLPHEILTAHVKIIKRAVFYSNVHLKVSCMVIVLHQEPKSKRPQLITKSINGYWNFISQFLEVPARQLRKRKYDTESYKLFWITQSEAWRVGSKSLEHSVKFRLEKWIIVIPLK